MLRAILQMCNRKITRWQYWLGQHATAAQRCLSHSRPRLELLEDRIVPAFNLALDAISTTDVMQADANNVRTFTALANDAVLNVGDIQTALQSGLDVVISTGSGGGSTGNILWNSGADLDFSGAGTHSLTLQTDSLDTAREVDIEANLFQTAFLIEDRLSLNVLTGGSDGSVTVHGVDTNGGALQVVSGNAGIKLNSGLN